MVINLHRFNLDSNILVMRHMQRQHANINVIQLDEKTINKSHVASEITKKINMLCTNDVILSKLDQEGVLIDRTYPRYQREINIDTNVDAGMNK